MVLFNRLFNCNAIFSKADSFKESKGLSKFSSKPEDSDYSTYSAPPITADIGQADVQ
jgi:hypothetical protein